MFLLDRSGDALGNLNYAANIHRELGARQIITIQLLIIPFHHVIMVKIIQIVIASVNTVISSPSIISGQEIQIAYWILPTETFTEYSEGCNETRVLKTCKNNYRIMPSRQWHKVTSGIIGFINSLELYILIKCFWRFSGWLIDSGGGGRLEMLRVYISSRIPQKHSMEEMMTDLGYPWTWCMFWGAPHFSIMWYMGMLIFFNLGCVTRRHLRWTVHLLQNLPIPFLSSNLLQLVGSTRSSVCNTLKNSTLLLTLKPSFASHNHSFSSAVCYLSYLFLFVFFSCLMLKVSSLPSVLFSSLHLLNQKLKGSLQRVLQGQNCIRRHSQEGFRVWAVVCLRRAGEERVVRELGGDWTFNILSYPIIHLRRRKGVEFWKESGESIHYSRQTNQNHFPGCNSKEHDTKDYPNILEKKFQLSTNVFSFQNVIHLFLFYYSIKKFLSSSLEYFSPDNLFSLSFEYLKLHRYPVVSLMSPVIRCLLICPGNYNLI
ncbi:hypothetical protein VP01_2241g1 [Puccinia sorghi]|uniref:Uncharacterized protein n=1 Tax=Puccinia sorghi TaxID=27349 RepID=A0A0L6V8G1_9BASI|nr:hypothetical protein VP01_2241g1 [Puccinia sorghi]